mgnify:FL=1
MNAYNKQFNKISTYAMTFYDKSVAELREEIRADFNESRHDMAYHHQSGLQGGLPKRPLGTPIANERPGSMTQTQKQRDVIASSILNRNRGGNTAAKAKENPRFYNKVVMSERCCRQMLEHAVAGGDNETMGMLVGAARGSTFVVLQTFELPVLGTETRVNAMSECYEYMVQYMDSMLPEGSNGPLLHIVGWYHSHPGYDCWLSNIDMQTQQLNQSFQDPYLAVVVDPKKSIADGAVRIGAYRTVSVPKETGEKLSNSNNEPGKMQHTEDLEFYELPITLIDSELDNVFSKQRLRLDIRPGDKGHETKLFERLFDSMKQIVALNEVMNNGDTDTDTLPDNHTERENSTRPLNPTKLRRTVSSSMQSAISGDEDSDIDMNHDMYNEKDADLESVTSSVGTVPENPLRMIRPHTSVAPSAGSSCSNLQTLQRKLHPSTSLLDGVPPSHMGSVESLGSSMAFKRPITDDLTLTLQRDNLCNTYTRNKRELLRYKLQEYKNLRFYRDTFTL